MIDTPPPRLPIYVRPADNDTLGSYIRRLAHANHLPPADLRSHLCAAGSSGPPHIEKLAAVTGRRLADLQQALSDTRCGICYQPLRPRTDKGRPARWCSDRCRVIARRKRVPLSLQGARRHALHIAPCAHCGAVVQRSRPFRWCCEPCRHASYEERRAESKCGQCGRQLQPETGSSHGGRHAPKWCSGICGAAAYRERLRARPVSRPLHEHDD